MYPVWLFTITRSALFCDNSENVQSITRRRRDRDPDIYTVSCPPPARQYCPDLRQSSLTGPTSSGQLFYYWVFWNDILWIGSQLDYTLPNTPTPSVEPPPPSYNSVQVEAEDPPPAYDSLYRKDNLPPVWDRSDSHLFIFSRLNTHSVQISERLLFQVIEHWVL